MGSWVESAEAIGAVDRVLAGGDLQHGRRASRGSRKLPAAKPRKAAAGSSKAAAGRGKTKSSAGVLRVPGWAAMPWLLAGFSTRQGGVSTAYGEGELNLGWTVEDAAAQVAANRRRFVGSVVQAAGAGSRAAELVTLRQFHSGMVRVVSETEQKGMLATPEGRAVLRGDGLITAQPGLLLGIQTADCVPVLLVDTRQRVVGAFHAGWRGTLARIAERGVGDMRLRFGSKPKDLVAAIGPAIAGCCFAVGEEVRHEFESQFAYAPKLFTEVYDSDPVRQKYPMLFLTARAPGHSDLGPQIHLDLHEANRRQLLDAGLRPAAISMLAECTGCTRLPDGRRKYFSHRMEHGYTGRMLSVVGIAR